jgi:hypothetical protein
METIVAKLHILQGTRLNIHQKDIGINFTIIINNDNQKNVIYTPLGISNSGGMRQNV